MACPASLAAGMYFPLPAPESRPIEPRGREVRNLVINGHGYYISELPFSRHELRISDVRRQTLMGLDSVHECSCRV